MFVADVIPAGFLGSTGESTRSDLVPDDDDCFNKAGGLRSRTALDTDRFLSP